MGFFDIRYRVAFIKLPLNEIVAIKKVRSSERQITYKDKPYFFDISSYSYQKRLTRWIFLDVETGETKTFFNMKPPQTPDNLDEKMAGNLLVRVVKEASGTNYGLTILIIVAVAGFAIGLVLGGKFL